MRSHTPPLLTAALLVGLFTSALAAEPVSLTLRDRVKVESATGDQHRVEVAQQRWDPARTAVIVCDVWDSHHCYNAVQRVIELAPRMNRVLHNMRGRGALIIHAPSGCMDFYKDHPARQRAKAAPKADNLPKDIGSWCYWIPEEEQDKYPIDQKDGGEDDDPEQHAKWQEHLKSIGRNPRAPWTRQIDVLDIDPEKDAISDSGVEVWNLLEARGIDNVILVGVHTNMCVLGRPFGLRRMASNGKNVVLMRDMTDTMYDPRKWPYVSHFRGTDLIVEHIEKYVCPTITSGQVLGDGETFVFKNDDRVRAVFMIGEAEYDTAETLPAFWRDHLWQHGVEMTVVQPRESDPNDFAGLEDALKDADLLLISVRRRTPPPSQLAAIRKHIAAGKPVVGIRTASHAFALRSGEPPEGRADWPRFDREVFGGNYHLHHGNKGEGAPKTFIWTADSAGAATSGGHPIMEGMPAGEYETTSWLYKTGLVMSDCTVLLMGRVEGRQPAEPVAWTRTLPSGSRVFYTSLGHRDEFERPYFQRLLRNGVLWAAGQNIPEVKK